MVETDLDPSVAVPLGIVMVTAAFFLIRTGWWGRRVAASFPPYRRAWEHADDNRSARIHKWCFAVGIPLYVSGLGGLTLIASVGGITQVVLAPILLVGAVSFPVVPIAALVAQVQIARKNLWAKPSRPTRSHGHHERQEAMTLDDRLQLLREELDKEN